MTTRPLTPDERRAAEVEAEFLVTKTITFQKTVRRIVPNGELVSDTKLRIWKSEVEATLDLGIGDHPGWVYDATDINVEAI